MTATTERAARPLPNAEADGPEIWCDNLVRIFKSEGVEVVALQGLDLRVEAGELVAIVGASGSGKSTLLNILSGLDIPSAGVAQVAGQDLLAMSARDRVAYRRETVGFLFQQATANLLPYLSAIENVQMPMLLRRTGKAERRSRAGELLDLLGIGELADRGLAQMSGGQQQRVALAVALANQPRVLLADEPTGELDHASAQEVFAAIREANAAFGTTVLVVTHDPMVSEQVQRTVGIRDGRTSSEVLRRTEIDEFGSEKVIAEEYAVLDRAGRLQLPREFTTTLEMKDRVRLDLEADHIGVWPDRRAGAEPSAGRGVSAGAERSGEFDSDAWPQEVRGGERPWDGEGGWRR